VFPHDQAVASYAIDTLRILESAFAVVAVWLFRRGKWKGVKV
jgi:hypothetical protein